MIRTREKIWEKIQEIVKVKNRKNIIWYFLDDSLYLPEKNGLLKEYPELNRALTGFAWKLQLYELSKTSMREKIKRHIILYNQNSATRTELLKKYSVKNTPQNIPIRLRKKKRACDLRKSPLNLFLPHWHSACPAIIAY